MFRLRANQGPVEEALEDGPHLGGGSEQPRHLDHDGHEGARVGLRQPHLPLLPLPERRLGGGADGLALVRGCGGRRIGGGGVDGDAAVGDVEEGDEVGAELDADEALEVRVAHDVGRHVADVGVEALRESGPNGFHTKIKLI